MEIERKFLIHSNTKIEEIKNRYEPIRITQDYIYSDIFTAIRKRKIESKNKTKYMYTIKTGRQGISVNEIEKEIDEEQYNKIKIDKNRIQIIKDRYVIPYIENLKIEMDIFHNEYEGVVFAEIEFESEEQAKNTKIPDWFGKEISDKISNDKMSKKYININKI